MKRFDYRAGDLVVYDLAFSSILGENVQTMWCCHCSSGPPAPKTLMDPETIVRCWSCPLSRATLGHRGCWTNRGQCPQCQRAAESYVMPSISPMSHSSCTTPIVNTWNSNVSSSTSSIKGVIPVGGIPLLPDLSTLLPRFASL